MINIGIIGFGYWGPNILRNFLGHPEVNVMQVCDLNNDRLLLVRNNYPGIKVTNNANDIFFDNNIDVVAIVTPVSSHYNLAKKALMNGKSVFVEKPFTSNSGEAVELIDIANKKNLMIMVDHTFLFTGAVKKIKEVVDGGGLGKLFYYDSVRINLGLFQHDVNVIWDLAVHDISIMDYLLDGQLPISINAVGVGHFNGKPEDVAYLTVKYKDNFIGHFHSNWLSPVKIRKTIIAGDEKMIVWNDLNSDEKVKIYDKGVHIQNDENIYDLLVSYRSGDMHVPVIPNLEALKLEVDHFVECLNNGNEPVNSGMAGLRIVKILEAANKSLKKQGQEIII
ncbi:MAG: Gfo/Idh/MocA family oxidoreductase [Bacteroidetes bacterium]|nr:Gfo/Idh/MocA family oxidoreductase [Bacteroidota bacterium]